MTDAISIALGGMQSASLRATEAANSVMRTSIIPPVPSAAGTETPAFIIETSDGKKEADPLQSVSEFQKAARAYEASAKALEAVQQIQKALVEALGWVVPEEPETAKEA